MEDRRARQYEHHKTYKKRHPEKVYRIKKNAALRLRYGITLDEYEAMVAARSGRCDICGQTETRTGREGKPRALAVDHDHMTGRIRGLLCAECNTALGRHKDDADWFRRAAEYLERS